MKLFSDIWSLLMALRLVDVVFFFAVLILMILVVMLIYFIMANKDEDEKSLGETQEMKIAKELKKNMKNKEEANINFTNYEQEQEDKAIINDDLSVKKVNLDNLIKEKNDSTPNLEVRVISFQKEEAFLEALKRLQQELG